MNKNNFIMNSAFIKKVNFMNPGLIELEFEYVVEILEKIFEKNTVFLVRKEEIQKFISKDFLAKGEVKIGSEYIEKLLIPMINRVAEKEEKKILEKNGVLYYHLVKMNPLIFSLLKINLLYKRVLKFLAGCYKKSEGWSNYYHAPSLKFKEKASSMSLKLPSGVNIEHFVNELESYLTFSIWKSIWEKSELQNDFDYVSSWIEDKISNDAEQHLIINVIQGLLFTEYDEPFTQKGLNLIIRNYEGQYNKKARENLSPSELYYGKRKYNYCELKERVLYADEKGLGLKFNLGASDLIQFNSNEISCLMRHFFKDRVEYSLSIDGDEYEVDDVLKLISLVPNLRERAVQLMKKEMLSYISKEYPCFLERELSSLKGMINPDTFKSIIEMIFKRDITSINVSLASALYSSI